MGLQDAAASSTMPDVGVALPVFAQAVYAMRYTTSAHLSAYGSAVFQVLILYDYFITLDVEIQRIWRLKWRMPKILFLMNRYVSSPLMLCDTWDRITIITAATIITVATAELILIPRVAALCTKMVYITLLGLFIGAVDVRRLLLQSTNNPSFIAECGAAIGIAYVALGSEGTLAPELSAVLGGCFRLGFAIKYQIWIPAVLFESVVIIFTLYKWSRLTLFKSSGGYTLRVLVRDSLVYFVLMLATLLANLIIGRYGAWHLKSMMVSPSSSIACIAAARMMLNLQSTAYPESTGRMAAGDDLRFVRRSEWAGELSTLRAQVGDVSPILDIMQRT
ncbi:hypothetical protein PLICRDRAFT_52866 [Plicaturopsis crispa FD-325 SS-3]|nr:hypothetical protein PLICRDRAFT_52866 [Plicaturopsis crispa FD-325 SS-3]